MDTAMTIGRAASAAGVTPKAIRLYERRGLLPEAARTDAGYRLFDDEAVETLRFIRRARRLGLHLDDIGDILRAKAADRRPCPAVNRMIDRRIADIDATIAELARLRTALVEAKTVDIDDDAADICAIIEHGAS